MRTLFRLVPSVLLAAACSKAPVVNITTVPPASSDVSFTTAYDIDEGAALDLVIEPGVANATITAANMPTNAKLQDGIFSFTPDYGQSGLYSVKFTITSPTSVTERTIGIRVLNVIHIANPGLKDIAEGGSMELTFTSQDPTGTIVTYSADVAGAPGASFDPVMGKLTFKPAWDFLDGRTSNTLAIIITAEGQELDTGKQRTSTAKVVFNVQEATSFKEELYPTFLIPTGGSGAPNLGTPTAEQQSDIGHGCISCHSSVAGAAQAGMDFAPFTPQGIYDQLVNHDVTPDGVNGSTCGSVVGATAKRVTPNDLSKSLLFMKITGTNGAGGALPCGAQMPNGRPGYYMTQSDYDQWRSCLTDECRTMWMCNTVALDSSCNLESRLAKKFAAWINAGAPNN